MPVTPDALPELACPECGVIEDWWALCPIKGEPSYWYCCRSCGAEVKVPEAAVHAANPYLTAH